MAGVKSLKITVTTASGEPSFIIRADASIEAIEEMILNKYGLQEISKKGKKRIKHEWTSETTNRRVDPELFLRKKISILDENLDAQITENKELRKAIKNLIKCLRQAHTKICYIDRIQEFNWIENHPKKEDVKCAEKRVEEILLRLKLEEIEKKIKGETE